MLPDPKPGQVWERWYGDYRVERRTVLRVTEVQDTQNVVYTKPWKYGGLSLCVEDRPTWDKWAKKAEVVDA